MKILSVIVSATVIVVSSLTMHAKIELPSVFSDNMVVQQNAKLTVAVRCPDMTVDHHSYASVFAEHVRSFRVIDMCHGR